MSNCIISRSGKPKLYFKNLILNTIQGSGQTKTYTMTQDCQVHICSGYKSDQTLKINGITLCEGSNQNALSDTWDFFLKKGESFVYWCYSDSRIMLFGIK